MKRIVAALGLLAALAVAPGAAATPPPGLTVWGPHHLLFGAALTVQGWAPHPGDAVTVHTRLADEGWWVATTTHAEADRHYVLTVRQHLGADATFYATSGSVPTAHWHHVDLVRLSCTNGGAAFLNNPVAGTRAVPATSFVALTAVRDSTWAGVAGNDLGHFAVVRWHSGHPAHTLARFEYNAPRGIPYEFDATHTVHVAAITPKGAVVADVEDPAGDGQRRFAVAWTTDGVAHRLHLAPSWKIVRIAGVTDSGRIVGVASTGDGPHDSAYVVWWNSSVSAYHVVNHVRFWWSDVAVDHEGDITYSLADGQLRVRLEDGQFRTLRTVNSDTGVAADIGTTAMIYGRDQAYGQLVRWDLSHPSGTGPITGNVIAGMPGNFHGAGRSGHLVIDNAYEDGPTALHLAAPDHRYADLPASFPNADAVAVNSEGAVAYTSAGDHLPHLFRCH